MDILCYLKILLKVFITNKKNTEHCVVPFCQRKAPAGLDPAIDFSSLFGLFFFFFSLLTFIDSKINFMLMIKKLILPQT